MNDKIFVDGLIVKRNEKAPEFVVCSLSAKVDKLVAFLQQHESNGWVNIDCLLSKNGKLYGALDTWRPTQGDAAKPGMAQAKAAAVPDSFQDDDIPF